MRVCAAPCLHTVRAERVRTPWSWLNAATSMRGVAGRRQHAAHLGAIPRHGAVPRWPALDARARRQWGGVAHHIRVYCCVTRNILARAFAHTPCIYNDVRVVYTPPPSLRAPPPRVCVFAHTTVKPRPGRQKQNKTKPRRSAELRDEGSGLGMAVLTTHTRGFASLAEGELEFMIVRRQGCCWY